MIILFFMLKKTLNDINYIYTFDIISLFFFKVHYLLFFPRIDEFLLAFTGYHLLFLLFGGDFIENKDLVYSFNQASSVILCILVNC